MRGAGGWMRECVNACAYGMMTKCCARARTHTHTHTHTGVGLEGLLGVGGGGEGVHKHGAHVALVLAEADHLLSDKVEEGVFALDLEQRL